MPLVEKNLVILEELKMVMICPYCDIEINEKQLEAEDGCCPECGALITASTVINEEDDDYDNEFGDDDDYDDDLDRTRDDYDDYDDSMDEFDDDKY